MKMLKFQQITDGRFDDPDKLLDLLNARIEIIREKLDIDGVKMKIERPYEVKWPARKNEPAHSQYRVNFTVSKATILVTWKDIIERINSVKAVPYSFI